MNNKAEELGCKSGDMECLCRSNDYKYGIRDCTDQACPGEDTAAVVQNAVSKCPGGEIGGGSSSDSDSDSTGTATATGTNTAGAGGAGSATGSSATATSTDSDSDSDGAGAGASGTVRFIPSCA